MKKLTTAVITILSLNLIFVSGALADDFGRPSFGKDVQSGFRGPCHQGPPRGPVHLIGKAIHDTLLAEVVYELTGKPLEVPEPPSENETEVRPPRIQQKDIAAEYGIDKETFRAAMDDKVIKWVKKALECGLIPQDQADRIATALSQEPPEMGPAE